MSIVVQHRRDSRVNCEAATPQAGELWYDTTLKAWRAGDGATLGGGLAARWGKRYTIAPAQLLANTNDWNPTDLAIADVVFLSTDAARNITGIAGGSADRKVTLINTGAFNAVLPTQNAGSAAGNRFAFPVDVTLRASAAITLIYNAVTSRWNVHSLGLGAVTILPENVSLPGDIAPAQIAANQNDYSPAGLASASVIRFNTDASRDITGLAAGDRGRLIELINVGTQPGVLRDANAGSAAANRFSFGQDLTLAGKQAATLWYDLTDARWKLLATTAGTTVAAGGVTAQSLGASALGARLVNGTIVESHAANAVTYALKTLAGANPSAADPVHIVFQTGTGSFVVRSVTAALSVTLSSGSSAGFLNNIPGRLWVVMIDTGAGVVMGLFNARSGASVASLSDWLPVSTTAEGGAGAADSAQVIYTAAAQAAKYLAIAGCADYDAGLAVAGTWGIAPSRIVLFTPGMPRPGEPIPTQFVLTHGAATGTTVIPADDTPPQQATEGDQYFSLTLTPQATMNVMHLWAQASLSHSAGGTMAVAIFQDATADALAVGYADVVAAKSVQIEVDLRTVNLPAVATTYKLKAGCSAAGTTTINGVAGVRLYAGLLQSFLQAEEIMG